MSSQAGRTRKALASITTVLAWTPSALLPSSIFEKFPESIPAEAAMAFWVSPGVSLFRMETA